MPNILNTNTDTTPHNNNFHQRDRKYLVDLSHLNLYEHANRII